MGYTKRNHAPKIIEFKIDDFNIKPSHVFDFEMTYSLESVTPRGYIHLADMIQMETQMFQDGTKTLKIKITDALDQKYKAEFKIIGGEQIRDNGRTAFLKLDLMEDESIKLSNTYKAKGYKETSIGDLLTEYFNDIKGNKKLDITADDKLKLFCVPTNKSFIQTIDYFRTKYNLFIFRTRNKFVTKGTNFILSGNLLDRSSEIKYYSRTNNDFYYYKIKDIRVLKSNRFRISSALPNSRTFMSDMLHKEVKYFDYSFKDSIQEISTPGGGLKEAKSDPSIFHKTIMRDEIYEKTIKGYYFRGTQDLKAVEIVVAANIDLDPGTKVNLDLLVAGDAYNNSDYEKFYKGNWIVYSVTDKIQKGWLLQKVVLIKPKL